MKTRTLPLRSLVLLSPFLPARLMCSILVGPETLGRVQPTDVVGTAWTWRIGRRGALGSWRVSDESDSFFRWAFHARSPSANWDSKRDISVMA